MTVVTLMIESDKFWVTSKTYIDSAIIGNTGIKAEE